MSKRKGANIEQSTKKQKIELQIKSPDSVNITKRSHHPLKENITWPDADIKELLLRIEANIPKDDAVSYTCRLEKLNWENIVFKNYSMQQCKDVWNILYKQVRKFRLLSEILNDIKNIAVKVSQKPEKHPLKPKQPFNSYMLFVEDKRQEVMDKNPILRPVEISKKLGQMFKNLPQKEKEKYEHKAKIAKQEYLLKLQSFYEKYPEMMPKKSRRRRTSEELEEGPPKKPKTPFELFVKVETEKEQTDASRFITNQKCRDQWHELSDKEKFFWINWADEMYTKYVEDLKEYIKLHPEYQPEKLRPILTKKEKRIKERCSGKPDKPPYGPYHLFSKMILNSEDAKKINSKDLLNYIAEQWRACNEEEKREYKIRVDQMWEEYHKKLEEWLMTLPPEDRDRIREEESRKRTKLEKSPPRTRLEPAVKLTKPIPPPRSAHKYFIETYQGKEEATSVWKKMNDKEKEMIEKDFDNARKKYLTEFENYLKSLSRDELQMLGTSLTEQYDSSSCSESSTEGQNDEEED